MTQARIYAAAAATLPIALIASPALAGTAQTSMPVSAEVLENCSVISSAMSFGPITDVGATNVDSTATITLSCTLNAGYEIQLNDGLNALNGQRRLVNATSKEAVNYDIYRNVSRDLRWGSQLGTDTVSGTASPAGVATVTAYGRIPAGVAKVSAGAYTDTITVTVNF